MFFNTVSISSRFGRSLIGNFKSMWFNLYALQTSTARELLSTRIKFIYQNVFLYKNMILEGVLSIQAGESPVLIERKLRSFILENNTETKE